MQGPAGRSKYHVEQSLGFTHLQPILDLVLIVSCDGEFAPICAAYCIYHLGEFHTPVSLKDLAAQDD